MGKSKWLPAEEAAFFFDATKETLREALGLEVEDIFNGCKSPTLVDARRAVVLSLKSLSSMPLTQMGSLLGLSKIDTSFYYYQSKKANDPFYLKFLSDFIDSMRKKITDKKIV